MSIGVAGVPEGSAIQMPRESARKTDRTPEVASGLLGKLRRRRRRVRPSLAIRVSKVVGLIPSRSAAPPVPRIRHPAVSSTMRMWSRSTSVIRSLLESPAVCTRGTLTTGKGIASREPCARMIARSTTLRSSRMLPGHEPQFVNSGRKELLASSGFAEEQHRGVGSGDALGLCERRADARTLANDLVKNLHQVPAWRTLGGAGRPT